MNFRPWIYARVTTHPGLIAFHGGRVFSSRGLHTTPQRPFLTIDFSTSTDLLKDVAYRQIFRIWVHDDPGNFDGIDQALEDLKDALVTGESDADVLNCSFSEDSEDLYDPGHNTVKRFGRYLIIKTREEV